MRILQTPTFRKAVKRLQKGEKALLDKQVSKILESPDRGNRKRGDLAGVYTIKLSIHGAQFRLAYRFDKYQIELLAFGPRENFYKRLK
ncbi:MAG: type II toxin-antitoxin system RelE/ParE family toxin [Chloroflexi bacterium]|nr:MAG: type II toxin-antitoxin system RelE/ParE family toxin [Chloroflexota bacterium]